MVFNASNMTGLTTAETMYDLIKYSNYVTNGIMGMLLMLVTFFILLSLFSRQYDFESSLMTASLISFVLALFLVAIELLNPFLILAPGIILGILLFKVYFSPR